MLQFEILVDMIEFPFAQDRPVSGKNQIKKKKEKKRKSNHYFDNLLFWFDQFFSQCQLFLINLEFKTSILRCAASCQSL